MVPSDQGLIPAPDFLRTHLVPRPSFNDTTVLPTRDLQSFDPVTAEIIATPALRIPLSDHNRHVLYTVQEFSPLLDSSSISSPTWQLIAQAIQHNYHLYDAFIILHGTDTMAYTSSALSFILTNLTKPVILTGSQKPFSQILNDATDNLLGALILAGHHPIPEVTIFFHHTLYRGNRATKVSISDFAAFASPNLPPLAEISASGTTIRWDLILPMPPINQQLHIHPRPLNTAQCIHLRIFPGLTPSILNTILTTHSPTIKGLILETFGAGNPPSDVEVNDHDGDNTSDLISVLTQAIRRNITIVNISQCLRGAVNPLYAGGRKLMDIGVVSGGDMTCEAALVKLDWCLGRGVSDWGDVEEVMGKDVRGEMS